VLLEKSSKTGVLAAVICANALQMVSISEAAMRVPVKCTIKGQAESDVGKTICNEFIQHLGSTYPGYQFGADSQPGDELSIEVTFSGITKHGLKIKLDSRTKDGKLVNGDEMSLIVTDREITPEMRASLYQQATSRSQILK
jgi:hypothetical protein